ncbi:Hypothetical protein CAP_8387 [Chondromyces apiculatus DSM 436]|uniref:Uncharacterized protein n=1 Tax=Chondromyces apiculatus DSM 436 TaxID=1192034 RepID=A0A017SXJ6_9BACT|nr:Hypothetical protein CAP_8387 [Chondromyces apiculatus DSM 436]
MRQRWRPRSGPVPSVDHKHAAGRGEPLRRMTRRVGGVRRGVRCPLQVVRRGRRRRRRQGTVLRLRSRDGTADAPVRR